MSSNEGPNAIGSPNQNSDFASLQESYCGACSRVSLAVYKLPRSSVLLKVNVSSARYRELFPIEPSCMETKEPMSLGLADLVAGNSSNRYTGNGCFWESRRLYNSRY
jgi:hypothetical protein